MNQAGLQSDMDAMRACLLSRKGWQLSKKERAVFYRWLKRCEAAAKQHED